MSDQVVPRTTAERIVDGIIYDLDDRRGLKHEWRRIDEDIRAEIREAWILIVMTGGTEQP
jgi:hypothetical protein